jgi:hypothetical protein
MPTRLKGLVAAGSLVNQTMRFHIAKLAKKGHRICHAVRSMSYSMRSTGRTEALPHSHKNEKDEQFEERTSGRFVFYSRIHIEFNLNYLGLKFGYQSF